METFFAFLTLLRSLVDPSPPPPPSPLPPPSAHYASNTACDVFDDVSLNGSTYSQVGDELWHHDKHDVTNKTKRDVIVMLLEELSGYRGYLFQRASNVDFKEKGV